MAVEMSREEFIDMFSDDDSENEIVNTDVESSEYGDDDFDEVSESGSKPDPRIKHSRVPGGAKMMNEVRSGGRNVRTLSEKWKRILEGCGRGTGKVSSMRRSRRIE